uniref:Uncharacterized protein n=1 Tax=Aegilops tauschii TaxID=37682 RepID=N1QVB4_AEGTA
MEKRKKVEEDEEQKQPAAAESSWGADLLPEILREILSRVPYRSLCRFRCVSKAGLALCSDPAVRRRSPQTLSGFFCYSQHDVGGGQRRDGLSFLNLSGWGRPLVAMSDDGNYVVCNPATKEIWAVLSVPRNKIMTRLNTARLCFDPAAPGRFVVFVFVQSFRGIQTVEAYSSDTGRWTSMRSEWNPKTLLLGEDSECVFLNGTLHLVDADHSDADFDWEGNLIRWMVTVDMEGKTWRKIRMPDCIYNGFIGQSQGRLYATHVETEGRCRLSVWVLEDYASGQWTLKCTASILEMLGRPHHEPGEHYTLIAIHPECSLIFLVVSRGKTLMSYDMDTSKLSIICTFGDRQPRRFQPYIPCFAEKPK